ncbi:uncharacterized protein [Bos indicus]|uniref:Uncharacterized protein isoform X4 n=1 Tax=Bos indicus TaxID=9915 RepID=A0ABM4SMD6_BOSIN
MASETSGMRFLQKRAAVPPAAPRRARRVGAVVAVGPVGQGRLTLAPPPRPRPQKSIKEQARRCCPDVKHIDVDINRAFRNNLFFWERNGIKQQALFHVLVAYSMYDTENICAPRPCPFQGVFLLVTNQEHPGAEVGVSGGDRVASRGWCS